MNIYLKAFIISFVIFSIGLLTGLYIEQFFLDDFSSQVSDMESLVRDIELEMLYFQDSGQNRSCTFLNEIVSKTNSNLDEMSNEITSYSESNILFTKSKIKSLKQMYTYLLIKDWLLQERIESECGSERLSILYFYSVEDCDTCILQGNILTLLKESFGESVMVFPLDINTEVGMVDILRKSYNVEETPSIVIGDKLYGGITQKHILKELICERIDHEQCLK